MCKLTHRARPKGLHGAIPVMLGLAALAAFSGCTGRGRTPSRLWRETDLQLQWPLPPEPPRVRYHGTISTDQIRYFRKGRAASFLDIIAGAPHIQLGTPHGISTDAASFAIADSAQALVHLFDLTRDRHRVIQAAEKTPLRCPIGVAVDGRGGVFVTDSVLARVFHFSRRGRLIGEIESNFVRPTGVAHDAARRRLYVVDTGSHAVVTFHEQDGEFAPLRTLGRRGEGPGAFNFPTHVALDGAGNVYVADSLNFRIQVFDPDGTLLNSFGRAGDGTGDFAKVKGVTVDADGHVYVVDSLYDVVQIFDRTGRFLLAFGGSGRREGELWLPTGICTDERGRIYVADSGNSRIQVYQYVR